MPANDIDGEVAQFGDCRLERLLGRGGMAAVYLAWDAKHGRSVALEVFSSEASSQADRERFLREIRMAILLQRTRIDIEPERIEHLTHVQLLVSTANAHTWCGDHETAIALLDRLLRLRNRYSARFRALGDLAGGAGERDAAPQ